MAEPMLSLKAAFDLQNVSPRSVTTLAKKLKLVRPFTIRTVIFVGKIDAAIESFNPPPKAWTAVGVIQGGLKEVRYYLGKKLAGDEGPKSNTIFYMGSVTKIFTSTLLAHTIEKSKGSITLDSKILTLTASLPPELYTAGHPWPMTLTLGSLARHQAGLPKDSASNPKKGGPAANWTYVRLFLDLYKLAGPDPSIDYSNFGIQLLGWSLALNAGTPWETLLATNITEPLDMMETRVFEDLNDRQRQRIAPPRLENDPFFSHFVFVIPAENKLPGAPQAYNTTNPSGLLLTTGPDMLKWLNFNLGLAGSPLDSLLGIIFTPTVAGVEPEKSLGWKTKDSGASLSFYKSGDVGDYHAEIRVSPTSPKGVFVMTNSDFDTARLRDKVWSDVF
jgi:CubicO group peptidase (beta-lactamase class C family)